MEFQNGNNQHDRLPKLSEGSIPTVKNLDVQKWTYGKFTTSIIGKVKTFSFATHPIFTG